MALTHIAPGDAALMLLVRMDRVRRSAYGDAVRQLLAVFYDYRTLLWSPEIDPVRDFDALLIATPNPYRVTETFLAIRHRMPDRRLRAAIEHSVQVGRQRMRWRRSAPGLRGAIPSPPKLPHDPRSVILRRGLALLARPEHELLLTAPVPGRGADDRASAGNHAAARPGQSPGTLLDALREMEFEGGGADLRDTGPLRGRSRPALLLQAVNLPRLLRLPPDVPPPHNVQLTVPASEPARVEGVLSFDGSPTAARFVAAVNPRLERARRSLLLRLMGVARLLDRLRLRQVGAQVEAHVVLGGDEVRDLLALFRSAIPQVSVPGMPLRVAPDKGLPAGPTDAGLPDAGPTDAGLPDGARTATTDPAVDSSAVDLTPAAAPAADSPPATAPTADAGAATDAD